MPRVRPPVVSASEALQFLHRAGAILGESLDFAQTLRRVVQLTVPDIADWCGVYALDDDGVAREVTSVHPDPRGRGADGGDPPPPARRAKGLGDARGDAHAAVAARDRDRGRPARRTWRRRSARWSAGSRPSSYMIVPLVARARALGAMTLLSTRAGRHYTEDGPALRRDRGGALRARARQRPALRRRRAVASACSTRSSPPRPSASASWTTTCATCASTTRSPASTTSARRSTSAARCARSCPASPASRPPALHRQVLETGEPLLDVELSDGRRATGARRTRRCTGLDGQPIGVGVVLVDITERRRLLEAERDARRRADFLARASRLLDASLDYEETLANVARIAVPGHRRLVRGEHPRPRRRALREVAATHTSTPPSRAGARAHRALPDDAGRARRPAQGGPHRRHRVRARDHRRDARRRHRRPRAPRARAARSACARSIIAPLQRARADVRDAHARPRRVRAAASTPPTSSSPRSSRAAPAWRSRTPACTPSAPGSPTLLQVKLLPERLPEIPGALLAARYRAAGELNEVGGDFYDVFAALGAEWALVVGDVSGKGAEAAAITALARYTLRAAALDDGPPSVALRRLNQAMLAHDDSSQFATVVLAYARPPAADGGMDVRCALGGHPPALVAARRRARRGAGRVRDDARRYAPTPRCTTSTSASRRGDVLVLYTDGVTEAGPRDAAVRRRRGSRELLARTRRRGAGGGRRRGRAGRGGRAAGRAARRHRGGCAVGGTVSALWSAVAP